MNRERNAQLLKLRGVDPSVGSFSARLRACQDAVLRAGVWPRVETASAAPTRASADTSTGG